MDSTNLQEALDSGKRVASRARFLVLFYFGALVLFALLPAVTVYFHPQANSIRNFHIPLTVIAIAMAVMLKVSWTNFLQTPLPKWLPPLLTAATLISFVLTCLLHYYGIRLNGEDFSIFDWMLYNTNHRDFMTSPICNMAEPLGVCHHFGVHPNYLLVPLAWLQRVFTTPLMLVVSHAVILWASLFPLYRLAKHFIDNQLAILLLLMGFATNMYVGSLLNHGFHAEVFFVPLGLWFAVGWVERNAKVWLPAFILFLLVKEDAAVYMAIFAVGIFLFEKRRARAAACILAASLAMFALNHFVVQPYFLSKFNAVAPKYMRFWGHYGKNWEEIMLFMVAHPWQVIDDVLSSRWWYFFGLLLFLPFYSRRPLLVCLAIAALFGISNNGHMRGYATYYPSPLLPFAYWGFLEGYSRLRQTKWGEKLNYVPILLAALLLSLVGGGYQRFPAVDKQGLRDLAEIRIALEDKKTLICAQTIFYPHLPYHWHIQPLSDVCLAQPGAIGIGSINSRSYDPYPYAPEHLKAWLPNHKVFMEYPSGIAIFYK